MSKYIVISVIVLGLGYFLWVKIKYFKITEIVSTEIGPFSCGSDEMKLTLNYRVNRLEGATSLIDITVSFGTDVIFKNYWTFKDQIAARSNKEFKFAHEYQEYLDNNHNHASLPSQEELIQRGIRPDERYLVLLASTDASARKKMPGFVACFKQNKDAIYDRIVDKKTPMPLFFDKVYAIQL